MKSPNMFKQLKKTLLGQSLIGYLKLWENKKVTEIRAGNVYVAHSDTKIQPLHKLTDGLSKEFLGYLTMTILIELVQIIKVSKQENADTQKHIHI